VVGKRNGGEDWISAGCTEYEKRLKPIMHISTTFLKTDDELIDAATAAKGHIIALDEKGKQFTSPEFTDMFYSSIEKGGATVTFIIGCFAGLPPEIRNKYPLVSLSKLTWTHAMARLLLMEQIYRATEIRKGSKYHKE
jgi:23S rRNA (pseudouridine1915-N3)-methyltransferase